MKKLLSILLTLVMLLGTMPVMADQTETPAWETLMDTLAESYVDSTDAWTVMDMAAYSSLPGKGAETSATAKQETLNALITAANSESSYVGDLTKGEIVLRAMGINSEELYLASGEPISNADALANLDYSLGGYYSAPWVLIAAQQGNLTLTETEVNDLIALLDSASGTGLFESEWDGYVYTDVDTAMTAVAALAPIYETNENAQALVDKIMLAVAGVQGENGSFGSANTDAMVMIGLLALGEDPATWNGKSVLDGMLTYVNSETGKFQFWGEDNELATEQAFRALVAYAMYNGENAVNFYDFSANEVVAGYEVLATEEPTSASTEVPTKEPSEEPSESPTEEVTEEPTAESSETPTALPTEEVTEAPTAEPTETPTEAPEQGGGIVVTTITVTVSIQTDTETWMDERRVTVAKNSSVKEALQKAIDADGSITAEGINDGYIRSFTKDGETLAEFDQGAMSGWKYKVNGTAPSKPFASYKLKDGDEILWYYTVDYAKEEGNSITVGGSNATEKPTEEPTEVPTEVPTEAPELPFKDVKNHWAMEAIRWAYEQGLMNGVSDDYFAPYRPLTRSMIVTILYRLEGEPTVDGASSFEDIAEDAWYKNAVIWAAEQGIIKGMSDTHFFPDRSITRQDLAVILYRYASYKGLDTSAGEHIDFASYMDGDQVAEYATSALRWSLGTALVVGKTNLMISPQDTASRAEVATILMRFLSK